MTVKAVEILRGWVGVRVEITFLGNSYLLVYTLLLQDVTGCIVSYKAQHDRQRRTNNSIMPIADHHETLKWP